MPVIHIPNDLHTKLKVESARIGKPMTEIIYELVTKWLKRRK